MKKIHNEHDKAYKNFLQHKKTFLSLLKNFVKEDWVNNIEEENLIKIDKTYILQDFKERESDIVYEIKIENGNVIFYCLLELQSSVDYQMPMRLLMYMVEIWRDYLKNSKDRKKKNFKLPSIIPMILYNGRRNWNVARSFKDVLSGSGKFGKHVVDFEYILIDVNRYSETDLTNITGLIASVFLLDQKIKPEELIDRFRKAIEMIRCSTEEEFLMLKQWLKIIFIGRLPEELQNGFEELVERINTEEVDKMVSNLGLTIDELKRKEREEGEIKKAMEIAKKMKKKNISIKLIAEFTGISEDEISKI